MAWVVFGAALLVAALPIASSASYAQDMDSSNLPPELQERLQQARKTGVSATQGVEYQEFGDMERTSTDGDSLAGENFPAPGQPQGESVEEEPSEAEQYFLDTLLEEKVPRTQVLRSDKSLKHYGFAFFQGGEGYKADPSALVGPDYVVGPGDTLLIDVWGNIEGHYRVTIDRSGQIVVPKVGVVNLWGQTFAQARETIYKHISKYFKHFQANISMDNLRSIQVFLVGEVVAPGTYQVSSLSSVLTALSVAGGPAKTGSLRQVKVLRRGQEVAVIDFYDFFRRGNNANDVRLQSGDTIFVPVAGTLVAVAGNVRRPGIFEMQPDETLGDVLQMAGGTVSTSYLQKVRIERVEDNHRKVVIDVNLESDAAGEVSALKFKLQDRDLVEVAPIAGAGSYVKLGGYVARPGDYQLTDGMRLADLLVPYGNLLPEYHPHAAQIIRRIPPEYRPEIVTVDLQQALAQHPGHNLLLQEYDEVRLFSREEMEELPEVVVCGAVLRAGTYRLFDNMSIKDLITAAGNLQRGAYLAEAEITRYVPEVKGTKVERYSVNLQKALLGHPQHNLQLQPEDHLIIRTIPDYGERMMVTIQGEVVFPGSYAISKGETLSSVLERAGGYTKEAYLRGAIFSRETLKEVQKKQIEKLIAEEEQQIAQVAQEIAAGAMSPEEAKSAETLMANRGALLEKLRDTPVTGRLVVRLKEIAQLQGSPEDIALIGGDEIRIPENPQTINIQGMVYNPTSLTWKPGKNAGYYLNQVGGTKEDANTDEMFIVRADGTVVSNSQAGFGVSWDSETWRWTFGGLQATELYPGDTVLVPEDFKKFDWMREVKDISTIIYQLALGAAAVASF
ncbi:MAG: SLBB domain-containing protein [Syntrophotaleaceae bacterium]